MEKLKRSSKCCRRRMVTFELLEQRLALSGDNGLGDGQEANGGEPDSFVEIVNTVTIEPGIQGHGD